LSSELAEIREELDSVTEELVRLLEKRLELCKKVKQIKKSSGSPVLDLEREEELIARLVQKSGLSDKQPLTRVLREVISMCRGIQKNIKISVPSLMQSYSEEAALSIFGSDCSFVSVDRVEDAFKAVEVGIADYCVTPYENTTRGAYPSALDALVDSKLKIVGEMVLGVQYHLVSTENSIEKIRTVVADPEAVWACKRFLSETLPKAKTVYSSSPKNTGVFKRGGYAFLLGLAEATKLGLNVLVENVQDEKDNATRFVVIGKENSFVNTADKKSIHYKTSLAFTAVNRPGSLASVLNAFSNGGINLTMIVSRPLRTQKWEYAFVIDLDTTENSHAFKQALNQAKRITTMLKVFGTYPTIDPGSSQFTIGK
jgi:chorismate mutase/prephenate dehydratase